MKFTVVFASNDSTDLSYGLVFIPCPAWVRGEKVVLNLNPENPHYQPGSVKKLLTVERISGQGEARSSAPAPSSCTRTDTGAGRPAGADQRPEGRRLSCEPCRRGAMTHPPLLIEKSWLPIAAIGAESQRERGASSALPPLYFLHVWWARRPLITSRAGDPGRRAAGVVGRTGRPRLRATFPNEGGYQRLVPAH